MTTDTFTELVNKDDDIMSLFHRSDYPHPVPECRGVWFRGYRNVYHHDGKFEQRQGIRLLKRRSCTGCDVCGPLMDEAREFIGNDLLIFPKEIVDGGLYTIEFQGGGCSSWSYEYEPDYDMVIVAVKENE